MKSTKKQHSAKEGLYAKYDDAGYFTGITRIMRAGAAHQSNIHDSGGWELITDNPLKVYDYDKALIPSKIDVDRDDENDEIYNQIMRDQDDAYQKTEDEKYNKSIQS